MYACILIQLYVRYNMMLPFVLAMHNTRSDMICIIFMCMYVCVEQNPEKKRYDLLKSWFPDLQFLTATSLPLLFTCANDYADLLGETVIMRHILGARFVLLPQENPFSFASTMVPPQSDTGMYAWLRCLL